MELEWSIYIETSFELAICMILMTGVPEFQMLYNHNLYLEQNIPSTELLVQQDEKLQL